MTNFKQNISKNICYTPLVYGRINKKLGLNLSNEKIELFISKIISETEEKHFLKRGKNIYIYYTPKAIRLTINSFTNRIITADKIKE